MLKLGPHTITNPIFLAPMAGITDVPTREIMEKFGIGLAFSEMVNAQYLNSNTTKVSKRLKSHRSSSSALFAVQLVGNNCDELSLASKIACDQGADIIDFNLGCPVKKVTNGYGGSSLLKDIDLVKRLTGSILESVGVPVTIKCRLGWDENSLTAPEIIKNSEQLGVSLVSIHARTRSQFFKGKANWNFVKSIKKKASIPLIINGDILNERTAREALNESGCDGIMIGRGLMGKPWLIENLAKNVFGIKLNAEYHYKKIEVFKEHVDSIYNFYGAELGNRKARKHIKWYLQNFNVSKALQTKILSCSNTRKTFRLINDLV